ncbi:unnamed protein product [Amaranthus hypochondriacus]
MVNKVCQSGNDFHALQSICYKRGLLQLLDQKKLPLETIYLDIQNAFDGCAHIDSGDEDEDSGEEEGTSKSKDEDENEEEWTSNADTKLDATEDEETDVQSTA